MILSILILSLILKDPIKVPIFFVPENQREGFDYEKDFAERLKENAKREKAPSPIRFDGIDRRRRMKERG